MLLTTGILYASETEPGIFIVNLPTGPQWMHLLSADVIRYGGDVIVYGIESEKGIRKITLQYLVPDESDISQKVFGFRPPALTNKDDSSASVSTGS